MRRGMSKGKRGGGGLLKKLGGLLKKPGTGTHPFTGERRAGKRRLPGPADGEKGQDSRKITWKCAWQGIERLIKWGGSGTFAAAMSEVETIECRPTRWFYLRAGAMVLMFGVFLVLFLKDWKVGWPKKNEIYYTFKAFEEAKTKFAEHEDKKGGAEEWEAFAQAQVIGFPDGEGILPPGVDSSIRWPAVLNDYAGYRKALEEEGKKAIPPLWTKYTDERGWSSSIPKKSYEAAKIQEQLYYGIGSGVLLLITGFFLIRTLRRTMKVDGEAYYAPDGARIPFSSVRRIDVRKWGTKGLAYLFYREEGAPEESALRKSKVDGMVYGQFKQEEGAPAEALFQRIRDNFKGELIELVESKEDEVESGAEEAGEAGGEEGPGENGPKE